MQLNWKPEVITKYKFCADTGQLACCSDDVWIPAGSDECAMCLPNSSIRVSNSGMIRRQRLEFAVEEVHIGRAIL